VNGLGKQRDPKRDEAFEIYKASGGEINLNVIAAQLGVGDGTLRGWKAKDKWDSKLNPEETAAIPIEPTNIDKGTSEYLTDDLYEEAIRIVIEANQASVSLLQRRMRIGYTRAARMIDWMESNGIVGPYEGSRPRAILVDKDRIAKPVVPLKPAPKERNETKGTERNAPIKAMERSIDTERSENEVIYSVSDEEIEREDEDEDGLTPKRKLFVKYYLINFNATQAAKKAGYSPRSARDIGYELLTKPDIKQAIRKHTDEITLEIGFNQQRILMEYLKIAFADVTDYVDFGQMEVPVMTMFGPMMEGEGDEKRPVMKIVNYVSFKESSEIDGSLISEVKQGKDGASIKLHDKTKALDILAKYIDLLPDKHKRMVDNERLRIEQERLELDRAKVSNGDEGKNADLVIRRWSK
jgi:phage terminase small subunit